MKVRTGASNLDPEIFAPLPLYDAKYAQKEMGNTRGSRLVYIYFLLFVFGFFLRKSVIIDGILMSVLISVESIR